MENWQRFSNRTSEAKTEQKNRLNSPDITGSGRLRLGCVVFGIELSPWGNNGSWCGATDPARLGDALQ